MPGDYVVCRSALIANEREARQYYQQRLAGTRVVVCRGTPIAIVFRRGANHVYTEGVGATGVAGPIIRRRLRPGVYEERVFSLDRAHLMDAILPTIESFALATRGTDRSWPPNCLVHGAAMDDGRHLRVVLGPGQIHGVWICRSAYPLSASAWRRICQGKKARFPR